ncbi:MAG: sugar phosphate nucleotidyltransferase, partial [Chthoniobacter sp.]
MNILILAAGYATRLYPLTQNKAKPLLEVAGKPMMEWVIDNLAPIQGIEKVYVVTNSKFAADFQAWADTYNQTHAKLAFEIINDG